MGRYINTTTNGRIGSSASSKVQAIINDGGVEIPKPKTFIPNLVCVVDNGFFGAAAYCYSENEFKCFNDSRDYRPKRWFVWEKVETFAE